VNAGAGGGGGSTGAGQEGGQDEVQGAGEESICEELRDIRRGTVTALQCHAQPFWPCQSPRAALHGRAVRANQQSILGASLPAIRTRPGVQINLGRRCRVCCFPHHPVLTESLPECAGGEAPPEFVKLHHFNDTQAWDLAV